VNKSVDPKSHYSNKLCAGTSTPCSNDPCWKTKQLNKKLPNFYDARSCSHFSHIAYDNKVTHPRCPEHANPCRQGRLYKRS